MKTRNLLPPLAPPVFRGDSQATVGHQQLNETSSIEASYFDPGCYWNRCLRYTNINGRRIMSLDGGCVLQNCAADYIIDKVRNSTAARGYVNAIQQLKNSGVI